MNKKIKKKKNIASFNWFWWFEDDFTVTAFISAIFTRCHHLTRVKHCIICEFNARKLSEVRRLVV